MNESAGSAANGARPSVNPPKGEAGMPEQTVVRERPIIFTTESVQAIMEGRKTQTRRVINPQPPEGFHHNGRILWKSLGPKPPAGPAGFRFGTAGEEEDARRQGLAQDGKRYYGQGCPYGRAGDWLWCKETWSISGNGVFYRADTAQPETVKYAWKSPLYMRRKDSRLLLEVVGIRVERLHDISEGDAKAEGAELCGPGNGEGLHGPCVAELYRWGFRNLWNSVNAKLRFPWNANPWLWVVEFKRIADRESAER
jgi:hypothetical protein